MDWISLYVMYDQQTEVADNSTRQKILPNADSRIVTLRHNPWLGPPDCNVC